MICLPVMNLLVRLPYIEGETRIYSIDARKLFIIEV